MPATMRISAIIPAYNSEAYLERAVRSLVETGQEGLEIVIVDDGSTDRTWEVARELQQRYSRQVKAFQHEDGRNLGVSAARNLGVERSSAPLLCFLDADDYVYPHRFDSALQILGEQCDVDGVYQLSEICYSDQASRDQWWDKGDVYFGFAEPIPPDRLLEELLRSRCWATSAILFRRNLLDKSGLFAPQLRQAEDCHLWFRMAACGTLVSGDLTRPVSAYWRHTASAHQPSPLNRLHMIRAMVSFRRWLQRRSREDARLPMIERAIENNILNGIIEARRRRDRKTAWHLAVVGSYRFPAVLRRRQLFGNLVRTLVPCRDSM